MYMYTNHPIKERGEGEERRATCIYTCTFRFEVLEVADTGSVIICIPLIIPSSSNTTESSSPSLPDAAGGTTAVGGASGGSGSGSDGKDGDRISRSLLLSSVSSSLSGSNGTSCVYMYMYVQGFLLVKGGAFWSTGGGEANLLCI